MLSKVHSITLDGFLCLMEAENNPGFSSYIFVQAFFPQLLLSMYSNLKRE